MVCLKCDQRSCGAMDNASDYGSEDSRFDSWQDRKTAASLAKCYVAKYQNRTELHFNAVTTNDHRF
ncbi:hypothetical protein FF38_10839 [Lucilia cuprina]|uniref:Uncharacterized protein n=1 Tax=Lucilia cuprina TaxID=7375 RepID=A0A0L0CNL1_LUCCU|nr:hypothetical protein FF38_10839 [Lucilia cuprina]